MSTPHEHEPFPTDMARNAFDGHPVDAELVGTYISAATEGCRRCQDDVLPALLGNPNNVVYLVYMACNFVEDTVGGLPPSLTDEYSEHPFIRLAHVGMLGKSVQPMAELASLMDHDERSTATTTAMDTILGILVMQHAASDPAAFMMDILRGQADQE
jgi:hypothetical protein